MATTESVRKELIKMHDTQRQEQRCLLTQDLTKEANEVTKAIDFAINDSEGKKDHLNDRITAIDGELKEMRATREKMLSDAKLNTMYRHFACNVSELHPSLVEFDAESDRVRKDLLYME